MFDAERLKKMDVEKILNFMPSEYWQECRAVREALNVFLIHNDLKELQKIAIIFAIGASYGEDNAIERIRYLEKQVHELTDFNKRLTEALQESVKQKQSIRDVKQEVTENE